MDELKDKFKSFLKPPKKFKGQGQKLGTAEPKPAPAKPQAHPAAVAASSSGASSRQTPITSQQQPAAGASSSSGSNPTNLQHSGATAAVNRVDPRQELKPATEFSPFTAVIGGGAACTTNNMNPASLADSSQAQPSSSSAATGRRPGSGQQQQQQQQQPLQYAPVVGAEVPAAVLEELQHCVALISSQPHVAVSSMEVLLKLLTNLITAPQEAKFRQLRLGPNANPKIQSAVLDVSGALDLLKACGFEVHADQPDSQDAGTFAYFLDDAKLTYVEAGLLQLQLALQAAHEAQQQQQQQQQPVQPAQAPPAPAPPAAASSSPAATVSTPAAARAADATAGTAGAAAVVAAPQVVARNTLVLLPAAPDADVPEWFFERTAAEVKREFMSLLKARQTKEVIASRAWKDLKLAAGSGSRKPSVVTLRVRFPEGVCLQGSFGVREPASSVFDWVTGSLRHPGLTYELITPSRSPLGTSLTVGAADLAGAVLNFRGLSNTQRRYLVGEGGRQLPFLSDQLLAQAQAD